MIHPRRWHSIGLFAVAALASATTVEAAVCFLAISSQLYTDKFFGETPELADHLGRALAKGDFDGDGYEDLALGAPDEDLGSIIDGGLVHIVYGGISASPRKQTLRQSNLPQEQTLANSNFGSSLAAGDFNDDGYDDLVVAAMHASSAGGGSRYFVIPGAGGGLHVSNATFIPEQAPAYPGSPIAVADFDQDGAADFALGQDWFNGPCSAAAGQQGRVVLGFGLSSASIQFDRVTNIGANVTGIQCGGQFGDVMHATTLDGKTVLLVGQPYYDAPGATHAGSYMQFGFASNGRPQQLSFVSGVQDGSRFGSAFASGDFNGDGAEDFAVGAPGGDGWVNISYQHGGGQLLTPVQFGTHAPAPSSRFGEALTSGNLDGDGLDDLLIGAPSDGPFVRGSVSIARGGAAGVKPVDTVLTVMHDTTSEFGSIMLTADRDDDGRAELVAGHPWINSQGQPAGAHQSGVVSSTRLLNLDQCN